MEWIEEFHTKQDEWAGVYGEPVRAFHRERAALIEAPDDSRPLARPDGRALVEVYTPWCWAKVAGRTVNWEDAAHRYDYDPDSNRMLDTWWPANDPSAAATQSLRCYLPDELRSLLESTGLELLDILPGGAFNHDAGIYHEQVSLEEAMQYVATLERV